MAISLPEGITPTTAVPVIASYGPWANKAAALAGISQWIRYIGMTVFIVDERKEYWWLTGTADGDLIEKTDSNIPVATFSLSANGSASSSTTAITLTFSQAPTDLTVAQITVTGGTKGTLTGTGLTRTLGFTPTATGAATISIANASVETTVRSVQVYVYVAPATFTVTANGSSSASTTTLTFTFSRALTTTLTAAQINVSSGTKGALSGSGTTRTLTFTPASTGSVTVSIANSDVETGNKSVQVYLQEALATFTVAANGVGGVAATTELTITFSREPAIPLTAAQITISEGVKGALGGTGAVRVLGITMSRDTTITVSINNADVESSTKNVQVYGPGMPTFRQVYGVSVDLANSSPSGAVTYTDDAIGMTPGSSDWNEMAIFDSIRPCVLKNGVLQYYLNPDNLAQKEDGSAADITSGDDGDVMIEIPKTGVSITTVGDTLTIRITDDPNNPAFHYYAHTREVEGDRAYLYVSAYLGWYDGAALRSLSGKAPLQGGTAPLGTIADCRTKAQANGAGYDLISFYPQLLLQCLYLIKYKHRHSQIALGWGYVATANTAPALTGGTNTSGIDFGEFQGKFQMKFQGVEDFWGNLRYWVDGLFSDAQRNVLIGFKDFNNTGAGYINRGQPVTVNTSGYLVRPMGTTETGFVPVVANGSTNGQDYFCDNTFMYANCFMAFSGEYSLVNYAQAGAFAVRIGSGATYTNAFLGARIMYL